MGAVFNLDKDTKNKDLWEDQDSLANDFIIFQIRPRIDLQVNHQLAKLPTASSKQQARG